MRKPKRSTAAVRQRKPERLALYDPRLKKIYVYAEGTFVLHNAAEVHKIVIKTPAFDVAGWIDLSSMAPGGRAFHRGPRQLCQPHERALSAHGIRRPAADHLKRHHQRPRLSVRHPHRNLDPQTTSHNNFATPVEYAYQFVVESA